MTPTTKPTVIGTLLLGGLLAGVWALLAFQLFVAAPQFKRRFDEYGLQLPVLTKWVLRFAEAWPVTVPVVAVGAAVSVAGVVLLRRAGYPARLPAALVFLGLSVVMTVIVAGLALPMVKLQEGLSK